MKRIIAVTGPSGSGKTTITNFLKKEFILAVPKHVTTRNLRDDDDKGFYEYINKNDFLHNQQAEKFFISSGDKSYYGIYENEIQKAFASVDTIIINCSLKDIKQLKKKNIPTYIIFLTFHDIETGMRRRTNYRNWDENEIEQRIAGVTVQPIHN